MSIEIDNPKTLVEQIDAAANWIGQIRLANSIGNANHVAKAVIEAERLLTLVLDKAEELERELSDARKALQEEFRLAEKTLEFYKDRVERGEEHLRPFGSEMWRRVERLKKVLPPQSGATTKSAQNSSSLVDQSGASPQEEREG